MKRVLIALVAFMAVICTQAQTEYPRNEVGVSYGALSNSQWMNVYEHVFTSLATVGVTTYGDDSFIGPISAEYFYHVENWVAVGGIFVYSQNKQDVKISGSVAGELTDNYFTLMPAVKFDWLRKRHFGMYSKLAAGATLHRQATDKDSESTVHVNWQATPLGLEAGSLEVRGFAELGLGEQGFIVGGIRYRF